MWRYRRRPGTWSQGSKQATKTIRIHIPASQGSQRSQPSQQQQAAAGVHSFKLSTRRGGWRMNARCSPGGAAESRANPPANPLNFKLTHMLGCLRTIIIITAPMITLTMKMMMKLGFLFFPHFFALQFAKLLMAIKDEGTASCLCLCLGLQPEIPAEIVEPFRRGSCCCCRFVFFLYF